MQPAEHADAIVGAGGLDNFVQTARLMLPSYIARARLSGGGQRTPPASLCGDFRNDARDLDLAACLRRLS